MISTKQAYVEKVIWSRAGLQCLMVSQGDKKEKAYNFPALTGVAEQGNRVVLNTTAVELNLGSGGYHFVIYNYAQNNLQLSPSGHIIKLRYTPFQLKVQAYEEILSRRDPAATLQRYKGMGNTPVVIGELHSMVAPFVLTIKKLHPGRRIVYIMTDSAALPLYLSNVIHHLQEEGLLSGTITCGQAFGGDLETVNIYTALIAAREELKADIILITPGPGVVGTGTRYGYSGIEQGEHIDRVHKLRGIPIVIPRISFADKRSRHYGLSHHTLTSLREIALNKAFLPLPSFDKKKTSFILKQLQETGLHKKHDIIIVRQRLFQFLKKSPCYLQTMGRKVKEDPAFFAAVTATAIFVNRFCNWPERFLP
ncbi:MAG: DUF3866 family protein [Dethiobacteria bacterium]|jgi:hypothetical protein